MKNKNYKSPHIKVVPFAPIILNVNPGSGDGEYRPGMSVDARRRQEWEEWEDTEDIEDTED